MGSFRVFETNQFMEDLGQELGDSKARIHEKLSNFVYPQLRVQPYFGKNIKKLKGYNPETWRYRIGDHRFFYKIDDRKKIIFMLAVDNRKDAY